MPRERITITIDSNVLEGADRLVDGKKIRSRSQAIEFIVSDYFSGSEMPDALILASGPRKSLTLNNQPKFMEKIGDKTILEKIVSMLDGKTGTIHIYIDEWEREFIEKTDLSKFRSKVSILSGSGKQGTINPLKEFIELSGKEFILAYCDTLLD